MWMSVPIDIVAVRFDRAVFDQEIVDTLRNAVHHVAVRIVDALFVFEDGHGTVGSIDATGLRSQLAMPSDAAPPDRALFGVEDVQHLARDLRPNTSGLVMAVEHSWLAAIDRAMGAVGGEVVDHVKVPLAMVADAGGTGATTGLLTQMIRLGTFGVEAAPRSADPAHTRSDPSLDVIAGSLTRLAKLRKRGLLTDREYDVAATRLLEP